MTALQALAVLVALAAILPLAGVLAAAMGGPGADIASRDILRYALTSAGLALSVGAVAAILGTASAWLVVMHRFPGRGVFAWALALPLAAPAFALAYAYADLLDVAGPLRVWMRGEWGADIPVRMRSFPGAVFVLSLAFYPYVYLAMRAAFLTQSVTAIEAARTLGCSAREAWLRVALPMARPALAAGVALAVMETLADYGALQFLSVQTLTTGVVRAWTVYGSTAGAAQFALPLLGAAAVLLWIERRGRAQRRFDSAGTRWRDLPVTALSGWKAAGAFLFCFVLVALGLLVPVTWLAVMGLGVTPEAPRLLQAGMNTVAIATAGAALTVALATMLALGGKGMSMIGQAASLGYVTPGAVMAIGLLVPASWLWQSVAGAGSIALGMALLLYAYAARLLAAAHAPIEAGLEATTPSMERAARTLGEGEFGTAWRVQLPIARAALLTGGLLVFVDILKELPATLILRPFNFDTLAVIANNYALDERLRQSAWPSLLLLAASLPAVIWLTSRIDISRPGAAR